VSFRDARAAWLCGVVAVATSCASSTTDWASFRFGVRISVPAEIDQVTIDGALVPLQAAGSGQIRSVTRDWDFASYATGLASAPVEIDFYGEGQLVYVGHTAPGACRDVCRALSCTGLSALESESIELSAGNFSVNDYLCANCVGPSFAGGACE